MPTTEEIIICCASVVVFVAVTAAWVWWDHRSGARIAAQYQKRLTNPDFATIERAVGSELPASLKDLYASDLVHEEFCLSANGHSFEIDFFEPIDLEAYSTSAGRKTEISLANDGFGNQFLYDTARKKSVEFRDHENGERIELASSIEEFITLLNRNRG